MELIIAIFSPVIGIMAVIVGKPYIKNRTKKKFPLYVCNVLCIIGFAIYISFLFCINVGKHIDSKITYTEYPIQKLTFDNVYFNDEDGKRFNESYVILEEPDEKYNNVVVVEREKCYIQWIYKFEYTGSMYHVYLSKELYSRFQDGSILYEIDSQ